MYHRQVQQHFQQLQPLAEQEQARLRKPRSDIGEARAPYKTKKKQRKERNELLKSLKPEERRLIIEREIAQE